MMTSAQKFIKEELPVRLTNGAALLVKCLEDLGTGVVFGLPGVHTLDVYDVLLDSGLRHVLARHEQATGFMADGYARASGKPGVCLVITGPGLTNAATALGTAYADSVPVLAISSQVPAAFRDQNKGYLHELRNSTIFTSCLTKRSLSVDSVEELAVTLTQAYSVCAAGRPRPVHVEIPLSVFRETMRIEDEVSRIPIPSEGRLPETGDIIRAQEILNASERPLMIVGGGAADASNLIATTAETLDCPVVTTCAGKGALPEDHKLSLGARVNAPSIRRLLSEADCVLVVGCELSPTDFWPSVPTFQGAVVYVDKDQGNFSRNTKATMGLAGDARQVLSLLVRGLPRKQSSGSWMKAVRKASDEVSSDLPAIIGAPNLDWEETMLAAIRYALPRNGIVCADMTTLSYTAISQFPVYEPRSFLHPMGFGTLGYALPAALGAKIAFPDRAVMAILGDGGFQFTMEELGTAVQERLAVAFVVVNNNSYGMIQRTQERRHPGKHIATHLVNPDFHLLSESYGIPYAHPESADQLSECLAKAFESSTPALIELTAPEV